MSKNILISSGCSHTYGSEILEKNHIGSPDRAWGKHLADSLGYQYETVSGRAWSNKWIYYQLYKRLTEIDPDEYKNYFVCVGWTMTGREYAWDRRVKDVHHFVPTSPEAHRDPFLKGAHKAVYYYQPPRNIVADNDYALITGMQGILKNLGINYLFFWAIGNLVKTDNHKFLLDQNRFLGFNDNKKSFWSVFKDSHWDGTDRWENHAPESYHKIYANILKHHIRKNKLL